VVDARVRRLLWSLDSDVLGLGFGIRVDKESELESAKYEDGNFTEW
jgi:hypothetical protein